jgi:uncharacterized delta-60 repeat protein
MIKNKLVQAVSFCCILLFTMAILPSFAQPGSVDLTFNTADTGFGLGTGANTSVEKVVRQADGKILIGGRFTSYNGVFKNRIIRLNADGTVDLTFNPGTGANDAIFAIAIQPDGKIIIGGLFTQYDNTARNGIARLNANGTLDATFNPGTGINGIQSINTSVRTIVITGTKLLVGGSFLTYNGTQRNGIARLNNDGTPGTDGSLDLTFNNFGATTGPNAAVNDIAVQNDGLILIGGEFTKVNGINTNRIARLKTVDGDLDPAFNPGGIGTDGAVFSVAIQSGTDKIFIGGFFTHFNGNACNFFVRLNTDGTFDTVFFNGFTTGVKTMAFQTDGKMISINGNIITRLNTDGTKDVTFNSTVSAGGVSSLVMQPDNKIIMGGQFSDISGKAANNITRLNTDGNVDITFNPGKGVNGQLTATAIQADGKILISGFFSGFNGAIAHSFTRLNVDGTIDAGFNSLGVGVGFVNAISIIQGGTQDGDIMIAGSFSIYSNSANSARIVRINSDGTRDTGFTQVGIGLNNQITTMAVQSDGKVIVGGVFTSYNGILVNGLTRLNADGTLDQTFNSNFIAVFNNAFIPNSIAIEKDGQILFSGNIGGNKIIRLNADGTNDATFNAAFNNPVLSIAIQDDDKIIAGGIFGICNGSVRNKIVRLNPTDGSIDLSFNIGTGVNGSSIETIIVQSNEVNKPIIIGGSFIAYNGTNRKGIARLNAADGSIDPSFDPGTGVLGVSNAPGTADISTVKTLSYKNGHLVVGGDFTSYNGTGRNFLTRLSKISQTITLIALPNKVMGDAPFTISATTTSGFPVTYTSSNIDVATVNGNIITIVGAGSTTITATLGGDINNFSSTALQNLTVDKRSQTINNVVTSDMTVGASIDLPARATSGLQVQIEKKSGNGVLETTYVSSLPGYHLTATTPGRVELRFTQAGNNTYNAAPEIIASVFCINPTKPLISNTFNNDRQPVLTSSSSTGNQWFLNGLAVNGATAPTLQPVAAGVYTVKVSIDGCASEISGASAIVVTGLESETSTTYQSVYPNPAIEQVTLSLVGFEKDKSVSISIVDTQGRLIEKRIGLGKQDIPIDIRSYSAGTYIVRMQQNQTLIEKRFIKE